MRAVFVMRCWLVGAVVLLSPLVFGANEKPLDPEIVGKDYRVSVEVSGTIGSSVSVVVTNFSEGPVRVPVMMGADPKLVVELAAVLFQRNSSNYLKPLVKISVMDSSVMVAEGDGTSKALELVRCARAVDWKNPGKLTVLSNKSLTVTVLMEVLSPPPAEDEE